MQDSCQYGKDTREMLNKMEARLNGNLTRIWETQEKNNDKIDDISTRYINRLPGWIAFTLSFLTAVIGAIAASILGKR